MQILRKNTAAYAAAQQQQQRIAKTKSGYTCMLCGLPIYFNRRYRSPASGKCIPLEPGTIRPHNCPMSLTIAGKGDSWKGYKQQQYSKKGHVNQNISLYQPYSNYTQCRTCGVEIYFDRNLRTKNSYKCIPLERSTDRPHQCPNKYYNWKKKPY